MSDTSILHRQRRIGSLSGLWTQIPSRSRPSTMMRKTTDHSNFEDTAMVCTANHVTAASISYISSFQYLP